MLSSESGKPVAAAWIVAKRSASVGFVISSTVCAEIQVAKTDPVGKFRVSWFRPLSNYTVFAYVPGKWKDYTNATRDDRIYLTSTLSDSRINQYDEVQKRINYLISWARTLGCPEASERVRKQVLPVFRLMYSEARKLATRSEDKLLARELCRYMYSLTGNQFDTVGGQEQEAAKGKAFFQKEAPECLDPIDDSQRQAFTAAIMSGDNAMLDKLIKSGFDPNRLISANYSSPPQPPIILATSIGLPGLIKTLVRAGANVDAAGDDQICALHEAILNRKKSAADVQRELVFVLLGSGANPNTSMTNGMTPLMMAVTAQLPDLAKLLIAKGAQVSARTICRASCPSPGQTALHLARDAETARMLIGAGADVNARDAAPDDFVLSLKASRYATNRRVLADAGESIARFVDSGISDMRGVNNVFDCHGLISLWNNAG